MPSLISILAAKNQSTATDSSVSASKTGREEFVSLLLNRQSENTLASSPDGREKNSKPRKDELTSVGLAAPVPVYADNKPALPELPRLEVSRRAEARNADKDETFKSRPASVDKEDRKAASDSRSDKTAKQPSRDTRSTETEEPAQDTRAESPDNGSFPSASVNEAPPAGTPANVAPEAPQAQAAIAANADNVAPATVPAIDSTIVSPVAIQLLPLVPTAAAVTEAPAPVAAAPDDAQVQSAILQQLAAEGDALVSGKELRAVDPTVSVVTPLAVEQAAPTSAQNTLPDELLAKLGLLPGAAAQSVTPEAVSVAPAVSGGPVKTASVEINGRAEDGAQDVLPKEKNAQPVPLFTAAKEAVSALQSTVSGTTDSADNAWMKPIQAVADFIAPAISTPVNAAAAKPQSLTSSMIMHAVAISAGSEGASSQSTAGGEDGGDNLFAAQGGAARPSGAPTPADKIHEAPFSRVLSQAGREPVLEQVTFNIKNMLKDGSSKISIQLDPEHLGKLEIKLHVSADGKTNVSVIAENKDTFDMLKRDSQSLERALSDAGLKTDAGSLSFNLRGGQQEQGREHSLASSQYLKSLPEEEDVLPVNVINRSYVVNLAEGLNIEI